VISIKIPLTSAQRRSCKMTLINLRTSSCLNQKKILNMSAKKNSKRDIPPWEDSPYNTFDRPLPPEPPGWAKARRVEKARDRARTFLGAHGCCTSRIDGDRQLIYLLSLCFGLFIDCNAKPKRELIRASRAIRDMGRKARGRTIRAALMSDHPTIRHYWDPKRLPG
jgi:hypothetical protein